jgi:hypothetical protein
MATVELTARMRPAADQADAADYALGVTSLPSAPAT